MYKQHEFLETRLCRELDTLEEKYRSGADMSEGDLRRAEMLTHTLKSLATYDAMKEAKEMNSYNNGRMNSMNSMNGMNSMNRMNSMDGMNSMNGMSSMRYGYSGEHFPYHPGEYPDMRNNW